MLMYKTQDTVLKNMTDMTVYTKQTLATDIVYTTKHYRYDSGQNKILVQTIPTLINNANVQTSGIQTIGRYTSIISME